MAVDGEPGVTRVLLVDDHHLVRAGLATLIEAADDLDVVGEASDGAEAVEVAARTHPDVVLMDLSMPVMDGVASTRALLKWRADLAVVVLTSFVDQARVAEALAAGGLEQPSRRTWPGGDAPSLRWILCHMIEEYARHNGHADLLREAIDGQTGE